MLFTAADTVSLPSLIEKCTRDALLYSALRVWG